MFFRRTRRIAGQESIAELWTVSINGVKQTLLLRGENRRNPLLLFLHGGPGSAQISFAPRYQRELEREFVVVNWDQRGAGLSYSSEIPKESMTVEQFVADTRAVTELLLERFGQEKLFLVGHSWGSLLGTLTAARYPHLFYAYVGMGQVAAMPESEAASYRFALDTARQRQNAKAVRELERIGPPPYRDGMKGTVVQRKWLRRFGGVIRQGSMAGLVIPTLLSSTEYTLTDYIRLGLGTAFSLKTLWDEVRSVDLPAVVPSLQIPVYYILGRYDQNCPNQLAAAYFERLSAPFKQLTWLENSAHLLFTEEPAEFTKAIRKVLQDQRSRDAAVAVHE